VRIGTWNLKLGPSSDSDRGQAIAAWLDEQQADLWLLTEVHRGWDARGGRFVVSPERSVSAEHKRWSGIATSLPLGELGTRADPERPGEESLVLARVDMGSTTVLVACSVLPWRGAGEYWRGLPDGQLDQFRAVLDHHVARIAAERQGGEPVVWGGDFNQPLLPPFWGATQAGGAALREAFDALGVMALTTNLGHLGGQSYAIDHLAVSVGLLAERVEVHRPTWLEGRDLSDHAAYTADVVLPRADGGPAASQ
jgi:hypothetical protein